MKHAIKILREAQRHVGHASPEEKKEIAGAIAVLGALGTKRLPKQVVAAQLEAIDSGAFAEYRLLWDFETEHRSDWHEIPLRLSPGDIVVTCREQFAESEERRTKGKTSNPALAPRRGPTRARSIR